MRHSIVILVSYHLKIVREIHVEQDEAKITNETIIVKTITETVIQKSPTIDEVVDEGDHETIPVPTIKEVTDPVSEVEVEQDETLETEEITTIKACQCLSTSLSLVIHSSILS